MFFYLLVIIFINFKSIESLKLVETLIGELENDFNILKLNNTNITFESSPPPILNLFLDNNSNLGDNENNVSTILLSTFGGILAYIAISLTIYKILKNNDLKKKKKEKRKQLVDGVKETECDDVIIFELP